MSRTVVSTSDSLGRPSSWAQTRAALSISSQLLDVAPEFRSWHRRRAIDQVLDVFASVPLAKGARLGRRDECRLRVIALSVVRDRYAENWTLIKRRLGETRHDVTVLPTPIDPGLGKFANLNRALEQVKLRDLDWIVLVDDDVILPARVPRPLPPRRGALRPPYRTTGASDGESRLVADHAATPADNCSPDQLRRDWTRHGRAPPRLS